MDSALPLDTQLRQETLLARERVYRFGQATPLERLILPGPGPEIWIKREDLSPIKAYKWRGACNRMAVLTAEEAARGVVTASAGNHAQGVGLGAKQLGIKARIYMPRSTPRVKQDAVKQHGGEWVEIILSGDSYDEAVKAAKADEIATGAVYLHAYDDIQVMAGQGTLADEVVLSGHGPFDVAFLQIGGGGMAAGAGAWLKTYWPGIELVAVEGEGQACFKAAMEAGEPVALDRVDIFCDGTAVRKIGENPFEICKQVFSRTETVSNAEVSRAIRVLWESHRCVSEPSGALGLAAVLRQREALVGKKVLLVISGANIDFLQLGSIAQSGGSMEKSSRTLRIHIPERPGTMLELLDTCFDGLHVTDFQYGKTHASLAAPVFTVASEDAQVLAELPARLTQHGFVWEDLTDAIDVRFRAITMRPDLVSCPLFLRLDFYERQGALHDFLDKVLRGRANICYFNYRQSGERIGRALIGLEFTNEAEREATLASIPSKGEGYRLCLPVETEVHQRLMGEQA